MQVTETNIKDLLIIKPKVFGDDRGLFYEAYQQERYDQIDKKYGPFVQDNISVSIKGTLRGLHFQNPKGQAKLISVLMGQIFDVVVDLRRGSPTFKRVFSMVLSGEEPTQMVIPSGLAHGFCVLSEKAVFWYKCSDYYDVACEKTLLWSDPDLAIAWPIATPVLSKKDFQGALLKEFPEQSLPKF